MEVLLFLGGLFLGIGLTVILGKKQKPSGTFVMDFSDPLKDICRLELAEDLNSIYQKKQIILTVETCDYKSPN